MVNKSIPFLQAIGSDGSLINAGYGDHGVHYGPGISASGTGPSGYSAPSATGTGLGGGYSATGPSAGGNHLSSFDYGEGPSHPVTGTGYTQSNQFPGGPDIKRPRRKQPYIIHPRDVPVGPGGTSSVKQRPFIPSSGLRALFPLTGDNNFLTGNDHDNSLPFLRPTNMGQDQILDPVPTHLTGPLSNGITNPSSPPSDTTNSLYPVLQSYTTGGDGPFRDLSAFGAPKDLKSRPTIVSSPGFNPDFFKEGLGVNPEKETHYTPSGTGFAPPSDDILFAKGSSGSPSNVAYSTPPPISGSGSGGGISSNILTGEQSDPGRCMIY